MQKSASLYESNGVPDIIGAYKGFFIAYEVKRPNQKYGATLVQKLTLDTMREKGVLFALVVEGVEEALTVLRKIDEE